MKRAAVLAERVLCADTVASRFGGQRVCVVDGPRRLDPIRGVVDVDGLDIARLLSRPSITGQARRAAALVRRLADGEVPAMTAETLPLSSLLTAWCTSLHARGCQQLAVLPRLLESPHMPALRDVAAEIGLGIEALVATTTSRPLFFLDDSELLEASSWRVVADAGQAALLATGLAADVVAAIIDLAGVDGADVWDKGFDDVGRALFVQRIERALRSSVSRIDVATVLPPLSSSTSKLAALEALSEPPARAVELARALRQRQIQQWQGLARIVVELRVPSARQGWWASKLTDLNLGAGAVVDLVAAAGPVTDDLQAALLERGHLVDEPGPGWLLTVDDADDHGAGAVVHTLPAPPPPPRAVGGVRAGGEFALDVGAPEPVVFEHPAEAVEVVGTSAAAAEGAAPVADPRVVIVPAGARDVRVVVDGSPIADLQWTPQRDGGATLHVPDSVRFGSIVIVSWNRDEVDDLVDHDSRESS